MFLGYFHCHLCKEDINSLSLVFHIPTCYINFCVKQGLTPQCTCPEHLGRYPHALPPKRSSYRDVLVIDGQSPVPDLASDFLASSQLQSQVSSSQLRSQASYSQVPSQVSVLPGLTTSTLSIILLIYRPLLWKNMYCLRINSQVQIGLLYFCWQETNFSNL